MRIEYKDFKLYLEGVLINFSSLTLLEAEGQPSSCSVTLGANSNAMKVLPGTIAQLFVNMENEYVIIFEGELIQKQFNKNSNREQVTFVFQAIPGVLNRTYKTPSAYLSNKTKQLKKFLLIDANTDGSYRVVDPALQQATDGFENSLLVFKNYFEKIFTAMDENDEKTLQEAFYLIFEEAEKNSEWYKNFAKSFRMVERLLTFPNSKALTALHAQVNNIFARRAIMPLGNIATVSQLLSRAVEHIGYKILLASCPTYGEDSSKSFIFLPKSDYFTPIKPNIFFGDEVVSAGFNQPFLSENTRLSLSSNSLSMLVRQNNFSLQPTVIAPDINFENFDKETNRLDYNLAEQYIGILPGFANLTGIEDAFANQVKLAEEITTGPSTQEEVNEIKNVLGETEANLIVGAGMTKQIRKIASKSYWDNIYNTRSFSLSTNYTPTRLVGLPGIFIDQNMPSIVGTVSRITTTVQAEGTATSSIVISMPRVIWEWDSQNATGLNDLEQAPKLDDWFDNDVFGDEEIGKNVYSKILGVSEDSSIFFFKSLEQYKNLQNDIQLAITPGLKAIKKVINSPNHKLNKSLKLALVVKAIKDFYYNLDENSKPYYIDNTIKRNLMSESSYWEFLFGSKNRINEDLGVTPQNIVQSEIYRDVDLEEDRISVFTREEENFKLYIKQRKEAIEAIK